ncbi:MAG: hypothetical protein IID28_15600 [Planctomycetes bacterium]|nr:hypothetical protein [Planctomycetota bacterium]
MKKFSLAALVAAACTSAAPAGFMIEDAAVGGGSWSQRIVLFDAGGIDFVYFEILSDAMGSGPFGSPAIGSFGDPIAGDAALPGWGILAQSSQAVAGAGPATTLMGVVLHFAGSITAPIELRGVAFRGGEFLFSATFNWDGLTSSGFHLMYLSEFDVWNPDQTSLPGNMIPLPAPVWLGSFGLLAVIVLRRRLL